MTDEEALAAVLNCDDLSGDATDGAWRAVAALRAQIQAVRDVCAQAEGRVRDAGGYGPAAVVPIMDVRRALDGPP